MANRLKGEASFAVDGEEYTLSITAGVLLNVEDETGVGMLGLTSSLLSLRVVGSLLRHGIAAGSGQAVTLADAVEMLCTDTAVHDAVIAALNNATPKAEDAAARP